MPVGTAVPRLGPITSPPVAGSPTLLPSRPLSVVGFTVGSSLVLNPYMNLYGYAGCGHGGCGYAGYGYLGHGYSLAPYPFDAFDDSGQLRLQVEPKNADVYVDGYYAGIVDDFDGRFQHLSLTPGSHHLEIVAAGNQPLVFDITIEAHHKTTYRGTLFP
jgi:hypothetical protein